MSLKTLIKNGLLILLVLALSCSAPKADQMVRSVSFNKNWQFYLGDSLLSDSINHGMRTLNLPHDWSIEGEFDENNPATFSGGALPGGIGWYVKSFELPEAKREKKVFIEFDGVYMNSEVWINDHYLGKRPNGYIGFRYDLSPFLNFGSLGNTIKVKVDNSEQPNSRWYSGSGIYRNVRLTTTDKLHIDLWGTQVTTPVVSKDNALVHVKTTIRNDHDFPKEALLSTKVRYGEQIVSEGAQKFTLSTGESLSVDQDLQVLTPELWSIEQPQLYSLISEIYLENELVDQYETKFGIRTFSFDLESGFELNGEKLKIKGVCLHHDLGALGAAINRTALKRRLRIMREMGVNAIRTTHNPPSPDLLDLCDEMGFLVMDEMFDMWKKSKSEYDYSLNWDQWHKKDLEDFIKRDRNHPSVIIWSIGNEILEQWDSTGIEMTRELVDIVKNLDRSRPITTANNPPSPNNSLNSPDVLDIIGYNYAHQEYEKHREVFPNRPFIATETTSALATRGYYDQDSDTIKRWPVRWDLLFTGGNPGNTVSSYDQVSAPWGSTHEETWKIIKKYDYLSGMFIWTGFDYLGEPTPYVWPSRSSYFGVVDLAGFPKDVYYMYQSEWTDKPVLHVFPHWNWKEGDPVDIWAYYSGADEVELFLNGKSLGTKRKEGDELHVMWTTTFVQGTLKAVSRKDGKEVLTTEIKTAGQAANIDLQADRNSIQSDGSDLVFVSVLIKDKEGILVPDASNKVHFEVKGPGKIIGVDNGSPTSHSSLKSTGINAFYGKCLVIVQSEEEKGTITLSANSEGLSGQTIEIISNGYK